MKRRTFLVTLLAASVAVSSAAQTVGFLDVTSDPSGVQISVDGRIVGRTPLTVELALGNHLIKAERTGYAAVTRTVSISREPSKLHLRLIERSIETGGSTDELVVVRETGDLIVTSNVPGQVVFLDGVNKGSTTLLLRNVATGQHTLRVGSRSLSITIYAKYQLQVRATANGIQILNDLEERRIALETSVRSSIQASDWSRAESDIRELGSVSASPQAIQELRTQLDEARRSERAAQQRIDAARREAEMQSRRMAWSTSGVETMHFLGYHKCRGPLRVTANGMEFSGSEHSFTFSWSAIERITPTVVDRVLDGLAIKARGQREVSFLPEPAAIDWLKEAIRNARSRR